jgi:hypothetical protein
MQGYVFCMIMQAGGQADALVIVHAEALHSIA